MLMHAALVALAATTVSAVTPLEIKGTDFVDPKTGDAVQIVGVAYQPGGSAGYNPGSTGQDPLSHPETCLRDAALMQVMGINAIRVYNLSPDINHDACASIFNAAGMYMMIDVNSPLVGEAIASFEPWTTYYAAYLNRTFAIAEAFSNYPNTLLYFSGNEVINDIDSAEFVPRYLRAVTRDLKNYIKNNIKRKIPVGYSAADVREVLWDTWNYMQCSVSGEKDNESRADFFALNSYSWCGPDATYESSTFKDLTEGLKSTSVPVFFSEYGCNKPVENLRYWNETHSIYGEMTSVFAGGVVYEYTEEPNHFGLVNITGDTLNVMGDYSRLKDQFSKIKWETVQSKSPKGKAPSSPKCEAKLIQEKGFDSNFTIPDVPPGAQELIDDGIKPKPSGKLIDIDSWAVTLPVKDSDGKTMTGLKVVPLASDEYNWYGKNEAKTGSGKADPSPAPTTDGDAKESGSADEAKGDDGNAAIATQPLLWAAAVPILAMLLA